jgi:diguanylate cyclase (GGDEF)-like protein
MHRLRPRHQSHLFAVSSTATVPAAPAPGVACDAAREEGADWDALFDAVTTRLRQTVAKQIAAHAEDPLVQHMARHVQAGVLECVAALEQLRCLRPHQDPGHPAALQRQVQESLTLLAQTRQALADLQAQEGHERQRARQDALTALPNRNHFRERLDRALAPASGHVHAPPAVLYLDLDGFKGINERHGNDVGDELLRIIAVRLARAVRSEDTVSRQGGDEFACLLADSVSREQLSHVACKLFDAVAAPVKIGPLQLTVRASIGIAICPVDGVTAGALLKSADAAMYHAKRQQSGYAFFDSCLPTD